MNQRQLIGTAFEYAEINALSARISNDLCKLISLIEMYKRPADEIKKLIEMDTLMKEYHFTYTATALNKLSAL